MDDHRRRREERETLFTGEYCTKGKTSDCTPLCGMGVRVKRIAGIGVKVYACGLYVDPGAARKVVGDKYVGKKPSDVAKDQSLYATVLKSDDVEKTVRLVFARVRAPGPGVGVAKIPQHMCARANSLSILSDCPPYVKTKKTKKTLRRDPACRTLTARRFATPCPRDYDRRWVPTHRL